MCMLIMICRAGGKQGVHKQRKRHLYAFFNVTIFWLLFHSCEVYLNFIHTSIQKCTVINVNVDKSMEISNINNQCFFIEGLRDITGCFKDFYNNGFLQGGSCPLHYFYLHPCAWHGQSSGLGPQAQRTNLALWDAREEKSFNGYNRSEDSINCCRVLSLFYLWAYTNWIKTYARIKTTVQILKTIYWQLKLKFENEIVILL